MEQDLRKLLAEYKISFKKAFGQNFLSDTELLSDIVDSAGVTKNDTVIEIGCGAGTLTRQLALRAKRVIGYEIDNSLKPLLNDTLKDFSNVKIIYKDIMKESLESLEKEIGESYMVVANLPYYITTPIVMRFLEQSKHLKSMSVMVQEEVAKRFSASPSSSDYGAITVGINLRGSAKIIKYVPREKFTPAPNVDSAVVQITMDNSKFMDVNLDKVRDVVRVAFSSRRKMLVNNIMNFFKLKRCEAEEILKKAGVSLTCRGENLSVDDFVRLSKAIK